MVDLMFTDETKSSEVLAAINAVPFEEEDYAGRVWLKYVSYLEDLEVMDSMLRDGLVHWAKETTGSSETGEALMELWKDEYEIRGLR